MSEDLIKLNLLKKDDYLTLNTNCMKLLSNMGNKLNELENKNIRNYLSFLSSLDILKDLVIKDFKFLLKVLKLYHISEDRTKSNVISTLIRLFQHNNDLAKKFIHENQNEFNIFFKDVKKERNSNNPDLNNNSNSFVIYYYQFTS
jgi:hypothetical protein